ncbi:MAG: DUF2079 domain-containing protein [Candidatus Kerfeldbacteria bacterium]|nr:DUF2079 domain-containing protein [Candidatus Kerfeldbacteria bacterium]
MPTFSVQSRLVFAAIVAFIVFFGVTNWFRHVNLLTAQFDMGNMDQVLWHSLHGNWFRMASPVYGGEVHLRTAVHADFLLLGYLPFYALWPDPRVPIVLQVVFVASGAIPLYWLARSRLGDWRGAGVAIAYLLYPTLQWALIFDVHAVILAMPLLLWAWWAMKQKRWWLYGVTAALAILGKEEVGLVVAAMGLYWVWRRGYRVAALASLVVGLGWSILMVGWAIPQARQAPGHFALGYFSDFGDSYTAILKHMITQPLRVLGDVVDGGTFSLLRALFSPLALLPLLGWPVLLVAGPEFAINLLSSNPNQQTIFFQYMAAIVPFIFIATVDGWSTLRAWLATHHGRWTQVQLRRALDIGLIGCFLAGVWIWSPLPGTRHHGDAIRVFIPSPYRQDVALVQRQLLPADRVATTNNLAPQFSRRELIWSFPNNLEQADAVVILAGGPYDVITTAQLLDEIKTLAADPRWKVIHHHDAFWYFRRVAA